MLLRQVGSGETPTADVHLSIHPSPTLATAMRSLHSRHGYFVPREVEPMQPGVPLMRRSHHQSSSPTFLVWGGERPSGGSYAASSYGWGGVGVAIIIHPMAAQ
jgi:uncharacterized membrane protein